MFVRRVRRRNKDGSETVYVQLVRSFRDPVSRKPRTEVLANLGREDALQVETIRALVRGLWGLLSVGGTEGAPAGVAAARPFAIMHVLSLQWEALGLGRLFRGLARTHGLHAGLGDRMLGEVACRLVEDEIGPDPLDGAGVRAWTAELGLPPPGRWADVAGVLGEVVLRAQRVLIGGLRAQVGGDVGPVLVLRERLTGDDGPLRTLVVAAAGPRIVYARVEPGAPGLLDVARRVRDEVGDLLGPLFVVGDEEALAPEVRGGLAERGVGWLMRAVLPEDALRRLPPGRFRVLRPGLLGKQVVGASGPLAVAIDEAERERARQARDAMLARLHEGVQGTLDGTMACCNVCLGRDAEAVRQFLACGVLGRPGVDPDAVRLAERADGRYVVSASTTDLELVTLAAALFDARGATERLRRRLENDSASGMDAPPVSALLGVLAAGLSWPVEHRTGRRVADVLRALAPVYMVVHAGERADRSVTEPTPDQRAILHALVPRTEERNGRGRWTRRGGRGRTGDAEAAESEA